MAPVFGTQNNAINDFQTSFKQNCDKLIKILLDVVGQQHTM